MVSQCYIQLLSWAIWLVVFGNPIIPYPSEELYIFIGQETQYSRGFQSYANAYFKDYKTKGIEYHEKNYKHHKAYRYLFAGIYIIVVGYVHGSIRGGAIGSFA